MSERIPLTVVIPVLNEARLIEECIRNVSWADQVIVVDGGSTDATVPRARDLGAEVLIQSPSDIAAQRNAGIAAARHPWVLAIDADERVTDDLREEIGRVIQETRYSAYRVRRQNFYLGQEQRRGRWGRDWVVRLFLRDFRFSGSTAHPSLGTGAEVGTLSGCLTHVPYRDLSHQLEKMNRYARWGAQDLYARGRRASFTDLIWRPCWRFMRAYVLSGSWRDGRFGLVTSILGAYTGFLKYAHLWALEREHDQSAAPPGT